MQASLVWRLEAKVCLKNFGAVIKREEDALSYDWIALRDILLQRDLIERNSSQKRCKYDKR